ncbi:MAG: tripartite tricarboxylate transporter substrate binding protein [Alphaproteobacteria bacterium]|nr:tripartite tricarboxylate transporter substrate binding protein [Alphaproteobacteria bacterium]
MTRKLVVSRRTALGAIAAGLATPALPRPALAQTFPDRPVRFVVPYTAGGGTDVLAREIARRMQPTFPQPIVIENRAGANTAVGAQFVANSRPDGYTLYFAGGSSLVVPPLVWKNLPYKLEDFAPVGLIVKQPYGLGANLDLGGTVRELIDRMKAKPDEFSFGHTGTGGIGHLLGERLMAATGTKMISVPYRGFQQTVIDIMGGRLSMTFEAVNNIVPFHRDRKVRILAITSDRRAPVIPDVPTFAEAGFPAMTTQSWLGLFAPAGTPAPIVAQLNRTLSAVVDSADFHRYAEGQVQFAESMTPDAFGRFIAEDREAWRRVVEPLNLQVQ